MEIKKAIELLQDVLFSLPGKYEEALQMAISALEKQVGRKPIKNIVEYHFRPDLIVAQCPSCKRRLRTHLSVKSNGDMYCPDCGQKIDWSEVYDGD